MQSVVVVVGVKRFMKKHFSEIFIKSQIDFSIWIVPPTVLSATILSTI